MSGGSMKVEKMEFITREYIRANLDTAFKGERINA